MLKLILFGLGCILIFEGFIYFLFAKKLKDMLLIVNSYEPEKIRSISSVIIILGLCLIYYTFKFYEL